MQNITIEALNRRLSRLEGQARWWRGVGAAALSAVMALILTGQGPRPKIVKVVEAERFEVRDAVGVRAIFGLNEHGQALLSLANRDGKVLAELGAYGDSSGLVLANKAGEFRIHLSVAVGDLPGLAINDKHRTRIALHVRPDTLPELAFFDIDGRLLWRGP